MKVLVLGASEGIGFHLSEMLLATGAQVAGVARSECPEKLASAGAAYTHLRCDLAEGPGPVLELLKSGGYDATIFSAAMTDDRSFAETDSALREKIFRTNVLTYIELTHSILRSAEQPHLFLFLSTESALQPKPALSIYSATKAALLAFARALAIEHRDGPHSFVSLVLGPTATPYYIDSYTREAEKRGLEFGEFVRQGIKHHFPHATNMSLVPLGQIWKTVRFVMADPKNWSGSSFRIDHGTIASL